MLLPAHRTRHQGQGTCTMASSLLKGMRTKQVAMRRRRMAESRMKLRPMGTNLKELSKFRLRLGRAGRMTMSLFLSWSHCLDVPEQ